jgi:hypothetical protein
MTDRDGKRELNVTGMGTQGNRRIDGDNVALKSLTSPQSEEGFSETLSETFGNWRIRQNCGHDILG